MPQDFTSIMDRIPLLLTNIGMKLIAAILIYLIGKWIARMIANLVKKMMFSRKVDTSLTLFVGNIIYAVLLIFVIIAAISRMGVQTTSFIALIGAAGLAVGLALQGTLSNFAGGVMLILFKPFKVGDSIIGGGQSGTVYDIGIFSTILLTGDNRKVIIPNSKLSGDTITNLSAMPTRKIDLSIAVPGATDIDSTRQLILSILGTEERILREPAPSVAITGADAETITFGIGAHVANADMGSVQSLLTEKIKLALNAKGIWA